MSEWTTNVMPHVGSIIEFWGGSGQYTVRQARNAPDGPQLLVQANTYFWDIDGTSSGWQTSWRYVTASRDGLSSSAGHYVEEKK